MTQPYHALAYAQRTLHFCLTIVKLFAALLILWNREKNELFR